MHHSEIYRVPGTYASFPYICGDGNGGHWAVFRQAGAATAKAAESGTHTHQDLDSRIMIAHREKPGAEWSAPEIVRETANDGYAVNDPALTLLADGTLLLRYARWKLVPIARRAELDGPAMRHFPRTGEVGRTAGNGFLVSRDRGRTWAELAAEIADPAIGRACARGPVLETADGAWLLPVYGGYPEQTENAWLVRSWDRGRTWGDPSVIAGKPWLNIPYREGVSHNETSVAAINDVTLIAMVRADSAYTTTDGTFISEGGVGELVWTISRDVGFTWDPVRPTGLYGQPADILILEDGRILCTFGHRRPPYGLQAAICRIEDDRFVVESRIVLRADSDGWDCGYPSSWLNADGTVTSVYYLHCGGDTVRHVACTDWSLSEAEPVS